MKRVAVHIDRLALNGFRPKAQHVIATGLRFGGDMALGIGREIKK